MNTIKAITALPTKALRAFVEAGIPKEQWDRIQPTGLKPGERAGARALPGNMPDALYAMGVLDTFQHATALRYYKLRRAHSTKLDYARGMLDETHGEPDEDGLAEQYYAIFVIKKYGRLPKDVMQTLDIVTDTRPPASDTECTFLFALTPRIASAIADLEKLLDTAYKNA